MALFSSLNISVWSFFFDKMGLNFAYKNKRNIRHKKIGLAEKKNKLNKNTPQLINIVFTGILGKIKNR